MTWRLRRRRPNIEVRLPLATGRRIRRLIADTGGASDKAPFELILLDEDCKTVNGIVEGEVSLAGAYSGWFSVYSVKVEIPKLSFLSSVRIAGVSRVPDGFDGIACFRFLNRFHYGNFGDRKSFGLKK
jgi:hypothetical protein